MGTRHLVCVINKGEFVVAQYGQWDGYLEGAGETVLKFLLKANLEKFKTQLEKIKFIDDELIDKYWCEVGAIGDRCTLEQAAQFVLNWPHLSRDTGAGILNIILKSKSKTIELKNSLDFAADSLFCEWLYLIDMDNNTLEIYKGFNKKPLTKKDRFSFLKLHKNNIPEQYYPVKLLKSYKFDELTANTIKRLQKEIEKENTND